VVIVPSMISPCIAAFIPIYCCINSMGLSKNRVPKNPLLHHRFPFKDGDLGNGIHPNIISS